MFKKRKGSYFDGQTILEYTVLIVALAGALFVSQRYMKRAMQGRWKVALDSFGDQFDYNALRSDMTIELQSNTFSKTMLEEDELGTAGWLRKDEEFSSVEKTVSKETIKGYE